MAKWTTNILNNPLSISLIVLIPVHLTDTIEEKRNKTSLLSHLTKPLFTTHCSRVHYSELIYGLYVVLITGFNCVTVLPGWRLGGDCRVTPLQSEEPEPGAAQWSQAHLSPGAGGCCQAPSSPLTPGHQSSSSSSLHWVPHHRGGGAEITTSLYIQIANKRLWRCQMKSERRDFQHIFLQ